LKKSGWFILLAVCTPALTDLLSSHIVKENIFRLRPCRDPNMLGQIRVLASYCPQSSSFTSSHAANHFGLATFLSMALRTVTGKWIYLTFLWALLIVYAQLYVGVHYPTDILGGAFIGVVAGLLTSWVFVHKAGVFVKDNQIK
ncbi:MAG TPA: phosphatase PAP2 family protein, partial [Flavisolibacter sp.]